MILDDIDLADKMGIRLRESVGAQIHSGRYLCGVLGGYDVVTQTQPLYFFTHFQGKRREDR
jgi:hypothetical protein